MTDIAKPTPGPWAINTGGQVYSKHPSYDTQTIAKIDISCLPTRYVRNYGDAELIVEAGTVFHETNLTPRQLLERVRELEAEQEELVQFFTELANDSVVFGLDTEFGDGFSVGVKTVCDAIKAALGKHGEKQ